MTNTDKQVPYRGGASGHCAVYALANIVNDPEVLNTYPMQFEGYNLNQVNDVVEDYFEIKYGVNISLNPFFTDARMNNNCMTEKMAKTFFSVKDDNGLSEGEAFPFIVSVKAQILEESKIIGHAIAVFSHFKDEFLTIVDNMETNILRMTVKQFLEKYTVFAIHGFMQVPSSDPLALESQYLTHITG